MFKYMKFETLLLAIVCVVILLLAICGLVYSYTTEQREFYNGHTVYKLQIICYFLILYDLLLMCSFVGNLYKDTKDFKAKRVKSQI